VLAAGFFGVLLIARYLQLGAIAAVEELGALDNNGVDISCDGAADKHAGGRSRSGGDSSHYEGEM
jgi:hypothetical protein